MHRDGVSTPAANGLNKIEARRFETAVGIDMVAVDSSRVEAAKAAGLA